MKAKPVIPKALAKQDVEETISYYLSIEAEQAALRFINALEQAYTHIGRHPATGSSRYAHELDLPGLRSWALKRYPYIVFYVERDGHIDVWRVLHGLLEEREERKQLELDALRAEIAAGRASGPVKAADAVFDRLEAKYAAQVER